MTISHPNDYAALLKGASKIPPEIVTLIIESDAHGSKMSEVQNHQNLAVPKVVYEFRGTNRIAIDHANRSINVFMNKGAQSDHFPLHYLPTDYNLYYIGVSTITSDDMNTIDKWTTARYIAIVYDEEPARDILDRLHEHKLSKTQNFRLFQARG